MMIICLFKRRHLAALERSLQSIISTLLRFSALYYNYNKLLVHLNQNFTTFIILSHSLPNCKNCLASAIHIYMDRGGNYRGHLKGECLWDTCPLFDMTRKVFFGYFDLESVGRVFFLYYKRVLVTKWV